jgi:hypothetical protein
MNHSGIHHIVVKIDSKKSVLVRTSNVNPIKINIGNPGNNCNIQRITVKSASIPHSFYNVTQYNNYFFIFDSINGRQYITIPEGQYDMTQLITYLNNTPEFTLANLTLSFNTIQNKLTSSTNSNLIYEWFDAVTQTNPSAWILLGLIKGLDQNVNAGVPLQHPVMSDLSGIKNIYIESSFSKMNGMSDEGHQDIAAIIPVSVPFGTIIQYQNNEQSLDSVTRSIVYSQNMTDPEFYLRDVDGNLLNMSGLDYELHWKVYMTHDEHIEI